MKKTPRLFDLENDARKDVEFEKISSPLPAVNSRQIRWYYVGVNIGQEISKDAPYMRPCIILGTIPRSSLVLIAPLSTKFHQDKKKYLLPLLGYERFGMKESWILLHHIGVVDKKRLVNRISEKLGGKNLVKHILKKYISFIKKLPYSRSMGIGIQSQRKTP